MTPNSHDDIPENILTAFKFVDFLLQEQKKKVVFFFDEIQELHQLDEGRSLQGSIREFAQDSKHIVFIFSGSNRRLLHQMFDDKSMPLYELCERIKLQRIEKATYKKYINKVAKRTAGHILDDSILEVIFDVTRRHPKRLYNLCYALWQNYPKLKIKADNVQSCWDQFVDERVNDVRVKLKKLSVGQLKVLTLIALEKVEYLTGKVAQRLVDLSGPTISYALNELNKTDYIELSSDGHYFIIDPLVQNVLVKYESYNIELNE